PANPSHAQPNALALMSRRTVPDSTLLESENTKDNSYQSTQQVGKTTPKRRNVTSHALRGLPEQGLQASSQREPTYGPEYDSDGEPKLPPPSIERDLADRFALMTQSKKKSGDDTRKQRKRKANGSSKTTNKSSMLKHRGQGLRNNTSPASRVSQGEQPEQHDSRQTGNKRDVPKPKVTTTGHLDRNSIEDLMTIIIAGESHSTASARAAVPPASMLFSRLLLGTSAQDNQEDSVQEHYRLSHPLKLSIRPIASREKQNYTAESLDKYVLLFSAPPPFSKHVFQVSLQLEVDATNYSVTSITVHENHSPTTPVPTDLSRWLEERLSNNDTKVDVSGICWGICQYWEAAILRAQLWARLEMLASELAGKAEQAKPDEQSPLDPRQIVPNLDRSCFTLRGKQQRAHCFQSTDILISCFLSLDHLTMECVLEPDISIIGHGPNAMHIQQAVKTLFMELSQRKLAHSSDTPDMRSNINNIANAVRAVVKVVFAV
ncbi:hypothetical protein KEM55_005463, partial [Ascosphaera atra]